MENSGSSTKQLKQVLGFWDLMSASVGQIIGAGVMTLLGAGIALTGRSIPVAFLIAAVLTVAQYISLVFIAGTVRLRGGNYTMVAMLAGKKFLGIYIVAYTLMNVSLSMYAISFASYFVSLLGIGSETIVALIVLTLFFVLNVFGVDKFAKVQNLIVILLVIALGIFAALGWGKIAPGYFDEASWMTGGMMGLMQAGGLLAFAVGGANCIVNLSAEAKNPTRDLPIVLITSTLAVSVLYAIISIVAAGVLPVEQVAGQNLSLVAQEILSGPLYVFFMVCGAGFALISTLNSQFAWGPKGLMQACDDGWLPKGLAKVSKWNTPIVLQGILYVLGMICILIGLDISILGNLSLIGIAVIYLIINVSLCRLPDICPDAWEVSKFKIGRSALRIVSVVSSVAAIVNIYLNATALSPVLLGINVAIIVGGFLFSLVRSNKVHVDVSYEKV